MLSKRYESTEVDRRTWLHVPSGTHWSTSSDTHQVVEIQIETSTKINTSFLIFNTQLAPPPSYRAVSCDYLCIFQQTLPNDGYLVQFCKQYFDRV